MIRSRLLTALKRNDRGTAAIEFALVTIPLSVLLMGSIEIGYRIYAMSVSNGAIREAARMASTGGYTGAQIDSEVIRHIHAFRRDAEVRIEKKSYSDFTGVGLPEPITSGSVESGTYCFQDVNGNGSWDRDRGRDGLGEAEDVIYYEVTTTYPTLFRFNESVLGVEGSTKITLNTIVSNEPFAVARPATPATVCK